MHLTRSVTVRGTTFRVASDPDPHFWAHLESGRWESGTLEAIDRFVTPDTTVVDIGAWVGPVTLYAAARARRVLAIEPDPVAFEALRANVRANPALTDRVDVVRVAVGARDGSLRLAARESPGDSTTSAVRAGAPGTVEVAAVGLETLLRRHGVTSPQGPVFVKVDVEGYEYEFAASLVRALAGFDYVLHLSTHPELLWASMPGGRPWRRLARRWAMIRAQARLLRDLGGRRRITESALRPLRWWRILWPLLRGRSLTLDGALLVRPRP